MAKILGYVVGLIGVLGFIILVLSIVPFILLWSLNFLGYNVPYTLETWFGALLAQIFLSSCTATGKNIK